MDVLRSHKENLCEFKDSIGNEKKFFYKWLVEPANDIKNTKFRYRNFEEYDSNVNTQDKNDDCDETIFDGGLYSTDDPIFEKKNGSKFGEGADGLHNVFVLGDIFGDICYDTVGSNRCFLKSLGYLTDKKYKKNI